MNIKLVVVSAALASAAVYSAPKSAHADGYGAAGCGLGAMIIGSQPGFMQIFAGTTNAIFGNQTFGITSGTLGCGVAPNWGAVAAKSYVETNRQAFAKDVARGTGETIANLSALAGCSNSNAVGAKLQLNYRAVFSAANATDKAISDSTIKLLQSDATLSCVKLTKA
jgi:hypothetical protein